MSDINIIAVARALGLQVKRQGKDTYAPCPVNKHEHDDQRPRCGLDKDKGVWNCLKCRASGDAVGLVKEVRGCDAEEAYEWLEDQGLKRKDREQAMQRMRDVAGEANPIEALARVRGWSADALRALGAEARNYKVRFPMKDAVGEVVGHKERRGDNEKIQTADGEVKSKTVSGSTNGLLYPENMSQREDPLVVTESEADAAAILSEAPDIAVMATPGATPGRTCRGYAKKLAEGREVVLCPDPDVAGDEWREKMGRTLRDTADTVRVVQPDLSGDIDDRLQEGETWTDLVESAEEWTEPPPPVEAYFDDSTFVPLRLAKHLEKINTLHYGYDPDTGTGRIMRWDKRHWRPAVQLRREAQGLLGEKVRPTRVKKTLRVLENRLEWTPWPEWDGLPSKYVACRNGLVNLDTGEIEPHQPGYLYRSVVPWDYRPEAESEALEEVLVDLFPDSDVMRAAVQLAGYCLVPHTRAKVFAFLHGDTDSGKTTYLEWLRKLVGEDEYAQKTPQELTENRFAPATLEGKLLNAPDELKDLNLESVERLKSLSGGADTFDVEHKGKDSYEAPMTATMVFACNDLPTGAGEADNAYYNRLLIIPFVNQFPDGDSAIRDEWPRDPDIMEPLLTYAIAGLMELRENDWTFEKPEAVKSEVRSYKQHNDPLSAFIDARCNVGSEMQVRRSAFCNAVEEYCEEIGVAAPNRKKICRRLRNEWNIEEPTRQGTPWIRGIGISALGEQGE